MPRRKKQKSFMDFLNLKDFNVNTNFSKNDFQSSFVEDERTRTSKQRSKRNKFLFARKKAIDTGLANPITPEEQLNASRNKGFTGRDEF